MTLLVLLLIVGCKEQVPYYKEAGERFHTSYHITYQHSEPLTDGIEAVMEDFNDVLNPFDENSVVSRFNRNETNEPNPMLLEVFTKAEEVSRLTDGAYDITGAPLFDLWGFGMRKGVTRRATVEEIDSTLTFVGYEKLEITSEGIYKADERLYVNPSSLSKGYVTDLVARYLEEQGVDNYLVEIGGEVVARGVNPHGEPWRIGVNVPKEMGNELLFAIPLTDGKGLATSGDYRNYKELDGERVAHTIDVRTGYPAHQDILSATVIATTCMEADAWATAFMSLGLDASIELLEREPQLSHLAVCFVYADGDEYEVYTKGIEL